MSMHSIAPYETVCNDYIGKFHSKGLEIWIRFLIKLGHAQCVARDLPEEQALGGIMIDCITDRQISSDPPST